MHVRTTATELAQWLEHQGGLWHVEGEPVLAKSLPLPTPASSLERAESGRFGGFWQPTPDRGLEGGFHADARGARHRMIGTNGCASSGE